MAITTDLQSKLVLFFDNDESNFTCSHTDNCYCRNVIQIKVNDSFTTKSNEFTQYTTDVDEFIFRMVKYNTQNENGSPFGEFVTLIPNVLHMYPQQPYVHIFDENSGIPLNQIINLTTMLDDPVKSSQISTIALDFDRTITMVEGFLCANDVKTFAGFMRNPLCSDMHLIELYMGGKLRLAALQRLLDKISERNIKLIILTNNPNPVIINDFIQTYIHNYGNNNTGIYRVISVPHVYTQIAIRPGCSYKLNVLNHIGLIPDEFNDELFPMTMELQSLGFNIYNLDRITSINKSITISKTINNMYKNLFTKLSRKSKGKNTIFVKRDTLIAKVKKLKTKQRKSITKSISTN
jgi:hypothetical protein